MILRHKRKTLKLRNTSFSAIKKDAERLSLIEIKSNGFLLEQKHLPTRCRLTGKIPFFFIFKISRLFPFSSRPLPRVVCPRRLHVCPGIRTGTLGGHQVVPEATHPAVARSPRRRQGQEQETQTPRLNLKWINKPGDQGNSWRVVATAAGERMHSRPLILPLHINLKVYRRCNISWQIAIKSPLIDVL